MDIEQLGNIDELNKLDLEIMFAANCKEFVSKISKKFSKRKNKNLFYIIFGVYLKQTKQYIVFTSIFKKSNKKFEHGNLFEEVSVDSIVYDEKQDVLNYLYDFINSFTQHERIINEEILHLSIIPANEAFKYLVTWNQIIFNYFNEIINLENMSKKKTRLLLKK